MEVQITAGYPLSNVVGRAPVTVPVTDGASAAEALARLVACFPALETPLRSGHTEQQIPFNFFVNRRLVTAQSLAATTLQDGDCIHILLPVAGG